MIYSTEIAQQTARHLLQIKAIKLSNSTPFQWASGWQAPIYCDNRKILSYPEIRNDIRDKMKTVIQDEFANAEVVAGVATGGIALGVLVAQELGLPFVYVRSSKKGHGLENKIEGVLHENSRVVVIEDLVSTGKSSLTAVDAIRNANAEVVGMVSVFDYGFEIARTHFEEMNCTLISLSDYEVLLSEAHTQGYVDSTELESLAGWRSAPEVWRPDQ